MIPRDKSVESEHGSFDPEGNMNKRFNVPSESASDAKRHRGPVSCNESRVSQNDAPRCSPAPPIDISPIAEDCIPLPCNELPVVATNPIPVPKQFLPGGRHKIDVTINGLLSMMLPPQPKAAWDSEIMPTMVALRVRYDKHYYYTSSNGGIEIKAAIKDIASVIAEHIAKKRSLTLQPWMQLLMQLPEWSPQQSSGTGSESGNEEDEIENLQNGLLAIADRFNLARSARAERELAEEAERRAKEDFDQAKVDLHLALKQTLEAEGAKTATDQRIRELEEELERCIAMSSVLADQVKHYEARAAGLTTNWQGLQQAKEEAKNEADYYRGGERERFELTESDRSLMLSIRVKANHQLLLKDESERVNVLMADIEKFQAIDPSLASERSRPSSYS